MNGSTARIYDEEIDSTSIPATRARPISAKARSASVEAKVVVDRQDGLEKYVRASGSSNSRDFVPIPEFRPIAAGAATSFSVLKEWEGSVEQVGISHFIAQLREVSASAECTDVAELPIGDIPAKDRVLLREGAIFRYLAGYAHDEKGTVTRRRLVYFRKGRAFTHSPVEQEWLNMAAMFTDD